MGNVRKRDGRIAPFDRERIARAIYKAFRAVGEDGSKAEQITDAVMSKLEERHGTGTPSVEEIQDLVETTLMESGYSRIAKAYILYRKQHSDMRSVFSLVNSVSLVESYLNETDWRVRENSNMSYSLQGLNFHVSSSIIANYWLSKLYPPEIASAHREGQFHLHDLSVLGPYCVGWDLMDLLVSGFGHVAGKISSKPPKHLRTALGQVTNFFYTLQGEAAGAQAFSNFDTLLAPFVRADGLDYQQVHQALQEFVFNVNVPTRVGFQCMSEDTTILTPGGWKSHDQLKEGDVIRTFNVATGELEDKPIKRLFSRHYKGKMYNLRNRIQNQLITPEHRVVRQLFNTPTPKFVLEPIEKIIEMKSPVMLPIAGINARQDAQISDAEIQLLAWLIAEGTSENPAQAYRTCGRITLVQSATANPAYCEEIQEVVDGLGLAHHHSQRVGTQYSQQSVMSKWRLNAESSRKVHAMFGDKHDIKFLPEVLLGLSQRQARLFVDTYRKADGQKERFRISTADKRILAGLQQIIVDAGYGFTTKNRGKTAQGKKDIFVLSVVKHPETFVNDITQVDYEGIVWCPNTDNETVIAQRDGKVFITGNTPFTNITMDLTVPSTFAKSPVIIGGEAKQTNYADYQKEMDMLNQAFCEVMAEGDSAGRIFTFPIPTYNLTKDFDWDSPITEALMKMAARNGTPYFANFVNSDMSPEDARSMCLHSDEEIVYRKDGEIKRSSIKEFTETNAFEFDDEGWAQPCNSVEVASMNPQTMKLAWQPVKRFLRMKSGKSVKIKTKDGKSFRASENHVVGVLTPQGLQEKMARDVKPGDYIFSLKDASELLGEKQATIGGAQLDEEYARLLGFFTADGNYLYDNRKESDKLRGLQFSFNSNNPQLIAEIKQLINRVLGVEAKEKKDPRYNTFYLYVYRKKIAEQWREAGFNKYGRLPQALFNSPKTVITAFLEGFFEGDGHEARKEIHINDADLSRDLTILYGLVGTPTTFIQREANQTIRLQNKQGEINAAGILNTPCLFECVPGFLAKSTYIVPGLHKGRMVGTATLQKYCAHTAQSRLFEQGGVYPVRVSSIEFTEHETPQEFFDVELDENHYFLHSLGTITHNCCRLRLDNRELRSRGGGLFGANPLTGSIGVVTLNLPRLAFDSKDETRYFENLDNLMDLSRDSLEIKRNVLEKFTDKGLYPYSRFYLRDVKKGFGQYWKNHFCTIGIVGMNESLTNLLGVPISDPEGKKFAIKVLEHMRSRLAEYQSSTGSMYNLEATPAESTSYRLARIDKAQHPTIKVANEDAVRTKGAAPFYTNSTQLPVDFTTDLFDALSHQDELQTKYTGGTVFHGFLGEPIEDWKTARELVHKIVDNYRLPYFTLTPTFSICPKHGYLAGEHEYCPKCDLEVGYVKAAAVAPRGDMQ